MEQKHESDMTKAEKRRQEWEKVKSMGFGKRVEYFVTYYKYVVLIVLAAAFLIYMAVSMITSAKRESVFSLAVIDADQNMAANAENLQNELLFALGTGAGNETVTVDINGSSDEDVYMAPIKLTTIMMGANTDAVVCNRSTYEKYKKEGAFLSWEEILGEDYSAYEKYITDGAIDLTKSEKWKGFGLTDYTPAYACVLGNARNPQAARGFLQYIFAE